MIDDYEVMTSLYTNVPIQDTLKNISDLFEKDDKYHEKTKIPQADLLDIIEFLLTRIWFMFNNECFTQLDGVAMGGPASSVIADIYMQHHDKIALTTFTKPIKTYERFVDDTLTILRREDLVTFYEHINNIHEQIKFTIEEESEGKLPFLDTLLTRKDNSSISVSVYRKPTHTDKYLNFKSNHSESTKSAVISFLFRRAREIVSDPKELKTENERIEKVLSANVYKKESIRRVKRKIENSAPVRERKEQEIVRYVSISYIKDISEKIERMLSNENIKCANLL